MGNFYINLNTVNYVVAFLIIYAELQYHFIV